jgi:EAL domain-containing protein (putative c-di-GMP-specific phosphodiesterase class I)
MIGLAKHLGMEVVAEGIEVVEKSTILQSVNCEKGQSYFLPPPLSQQAATEMIEKEVSSDSRRARDSHECEI